MWKNNGFSRAKSTFVAEGGVAGWELENDKNPEKTAIIMVKSDRYRPLFGSKATDSSASRADSSESEREGDKKRPHLPAKWLDAISDLPR